MTGSVVALWTLIGTFILIVGIAIAVGLWRFLSPGFGNHGDAVCPHCGARGGDYTYGHEIGFHHLCWRRLRAHLHFRCRRCEGDWLAEPGAWKKPAEPAKGEATSNPQART